MPIAGASFTSLPKLDKNSRMQKALFIVVTAFLLPGATFAASDLLPHWQKTGELADLKSLADLDEAMKKPISPNGQPGVELSKSIDEKSVKKIARHCDEYLELKGQGFEPTSTFDHVQESFFKSRCRALEFLRRAKPAKQSFVKNYAWNAQSLRELPACVGGMGGDSSYRAKLKLASDTGTSWAAFAPDMKIKEAKGDSLTFANAGEEITVAPVAWGDEDGDGLEDILVSVATRATQGSYRAFDDYVLTRRPKDTLFRVIRGGSPGDCRPASDEPTGCSWDKVDEQLGQFKKISAARNYRDAYALLNRTKDECFKTLSSERQLWFLSELALAAFKVGDRARCLEILDESNGNEALEWDSSKKAVEALNYNRKLCRGKDH